MKGSKYHSISPFSKNGSDPVSKSNKGLRLKFPNMFKTRGENQEHKITSSAITFPVITPELNLNST